MDLTGKKFGHIEVRWRSRKKRNSSWFCYCTCGKNQCLRRFSLDEESLVSGKAESCDSYDIHRKKKDLNENKFIKIPDSELSRLWKRYKDSSRRRQKDFNLSPGLFAHLVRSGCAYCGSHGSPYNGIDRVDNKYGYIPGNVASCCRDCNMMKNTMSFNDFFIKCRRIIEHLQEREHG